MTKITPYTALCELFRHKIDSNDLKKHSTPTEQHENVVTQQNKRKKLVTIHNSCQTQPLRDYSFDQVRGKQKIQKKYCTRDMHAINISLKDDNFQILQPDYAAYSGEKPYSESTPCRNRFNIMQMPEKLSNNNTSFFNRSLENRNSLKINNQTMTSLESTFQEKIVKSSNVNRFKIQNDVNRERVMPELNLYRNDTKDKYKYQIHSTCKDPKVHALYKTVSHLKKTFEDKYHHEEKCLCEHCGALAVVNESLKRPIIYDSYEEDEDEHQHYRRHRKKSRRSKHDDKEYMKLIVKLKMMEERINELEELHYIQGPIKIQNSSPTYDMYTQCGKKKKKIRFDTPECRSFSPKRFCNKGCPFPFTLPSTIKERIFKQRSSQDTGSDDDSDYKVKHVSRNPYRENTPQPKLRCHEYMKKKQLENDAPPKKTFWKTGSKTYNVTSIDNEDANIPTKDTNTINDKQIQELLLELSKKKIKTVNPETKAVRFTLNPKATDTKILYERKQDILSSKSNCLDSDMKFLSGESFKKNSTIPEIISEESDLFLLKAPDVIEQLVRAIPKEASHPNSINHSEKTIPESNYLMSRDLFQSSVSSAKPSSIEQEKIKALVENITISKTTFSKSVCQYINSNYTNKTTTTNDTDSCATVRQTYKRSRSLSPDNTNTSENIVPKIDTKRKKLTLPNANYKRPQSLDRDGKPKNFIELNKNVSRYARNLSARPKKDYASLSRSPYRPPKNSPIQIYTGSVEEENVKRDLPRKKWNFPLLDTNPHETNFEQLNKEKIIRQLSKLSESTSNSFEIDTSEVATTTTISNDTASTSKTCSKEVIKKRSSIFSVIKRYSKQFISKRKPKKNSPDNESNLIPCNNNERVESKKTTNSNDKNVSKIPVYRTPDRSRNSSRVPSPERKDKYTNEHIASTDKKATANDKIFVFEGNKNNQNNFNKYEEVKNRSNVEPNFDLSINTLVINKTMSNIIVYNTNLPIISEQITGKAKNLTMQNNVPHNCMPTFFWNEKPVSKIRILPAKEQQQVNYATVNKKQVKFTEAKQSTSKPSTNRSSDTKFPLQDNKCTKSNTDPINKEETNSCCKNKPLNPPRSSGVRSGLRNNKKDPKSAVHAKRDIPTPKPSKVLQKDSCNQNITGEQKKSSKPGTGKGNTKSSSIPVPMKQPQETKADVKPNTSKCAPESSCSKSSVKSSPQVQNEDHKTKKVAPKKGCSKCSIKSNESTVKDKPKKEAPIRSPSKCGGITCTDSTVKEKTKKKAPESSSSTCGMKCIEPTVKEKPKKEPPIKSASKCGGIKCTESTVKDKTKKKAPVSSPSTCGMKCIDPVKEKTKKEPAIKISSKCGGIKCSEPAVKDKPKNEAPFSSSSTCGMKCVDPKLKGKTKNESPIRCYGKCGVKCTETTVKDQARNEEDIETLHTSKCKCVGSSQDVLLDPEDDDKNQKPTKCGTAKCSASHSSLMILIDYGDQNQPVSENYACQEQEFTTAKYKCATSQDILIDPEESCRNESAKYGTGKCNYKDQNVPVSDIPSCSYEPSSQSTEMLGRRGVCTTNKLRKRSSSECNLICASHSSLMKINEYTEQNLPESEDTCQKPCGIPQCTYVPSAHGILMIGPGKTCKKNIPGQGGTGKCNSRSASCASPKSLKKLNKCKNQNDPLSQKNDSCQRQDIPSCTYEPSSHGILMIGSGKTCKKNIAGQSGTGKCNSRCASCASHRSLRNLNKCIDQKLPVNQKKDSCQPCNDTSTIDKIKDNPSGTSVSSSHSIIILGRGSSRKNKRDSSKCSFRCASRSSLKKLNEYTEQNLPESEDTCQKLCGIPPCTYVPSSHGILMIGPGKICKKNIPGQGGTGKCNSRCASCASPKSLKKLNKFKDQNDPLSQKNDSCQRQDIPSCTYEPSSHGILMIGSGKTCKKNIAGQSGTGKCNARCASCASHRSLRNLNKCIDQKLPVNQKKDSCQPCNDTSTIDKIKDNPSGTSVSSSHSIIILGRGSSRKNKRDSSKCSLRCASRSSLKKLNDCMDQNLPVNEKNNTSCTCVPSSHSMNKPGKRGKGKCKRCAPPPPIKKVKSKCNCSLSNLSISFETMSRSSKQQCNKPVSSNKKDKVPNCGCGSNELPKLPFQPAFAKCNPERCASRVAGSFERQKKSECKKTTFKRSKQNLGKKTPPKNSTHDLKGKRKCTKTKGSSANTSKSKSSTSSKKSSRGSSCSSCPECKSTQSSFKRSTLTIKSSIKRICNLRKMKKKIASKFSFKYFRNLYKRPIFAGASRSKCREMRMKMRNFCDVSKRDFGNDCPNMTDTKCSCSLMYGSTGINRSVVNLYYNMQRFSFDPSPSEDLSYTDEDLHLTEDEKRSYLIEKLYLLQDFRDRIHDERSSSNYGAFE